MKKIVLFTSKNFNLFPARLKIFVSRLLIKILKTFLYLIPKQYLSLVIIYFQKFIMNQVKILVMLNLIQFTKN